MRVSGLVPVVLCTAACTPGDQLGPDRDREPDPPPPALVSFRLVDTLSPWRVVGGPTFQATLSPAAAAWHATTITIGSGVFAQVLQVDGHGTLHVFPPGYAVLTTPLAPYVAMGLDACGRTEEARGRCLKPIPVRRVAAELNLARVRDSFALRDDGSWWETITATGEVIARETPIVALVAVARGCGARPSIEVRLDASDMVPLGNQRFGFRVVLAGIADDTLDEPYTCNARRLHFRLSDAGRYDTAIDCDGLSASLQPSDVTSCRDEEVSRVPIR
jgi:hypothetical protein